MEPSVSLDRITIVGTLRRSFDLAQDGYLPMDSLSGCAGFVGGYDTDTHCHVSQRDRQLRLDYNPNNGTARNYLDLLGARHCTRVDVAIDYGCDLSEFEWLHPRRKRVVHYGQGGQMETTYLGRFGSPVMVRVYNKTEEQKLTDGIDRWRCEAQRRAKPECEPLPSNLFDGVSAYPRAIPRGVSVHDAALLALAVCSPDQFKLLDRRTRKRLSEEYGTRYLPDIPTEVYNSKRSVLQAQLAEEIGV